jgi:hypothetical protein
MMADSIPPHLDPSLWLSDQPVTISVKGISMAPFFKEGDRVEVVRAAPGDLKAGDLIVFLRSGEVVIHRFLAVRGGLFLEKGDGQGRGNWAPWPDALGRVVALWKAEERLDFTVDPWPCRMASLGRTHLRAHRAAIFAEKLPGTLLRRVFLRLCR